MARWLGVKQQAFRWATLPRQDGGLRAPTRRAPETLHRNFAAREGRRFQLSLNRDGPLVFSCAPCIWRSGRTGGRGEPPAQKHGAVCADCLAKKRTPRASGVFTGALNPAPITCESPLCQSADRKITAVGLSRPQISN